MSSGKQRGLTLLELLVVFVIVGLISTLLMQGLGFGLSMLERVHTRSESLKQEVMLRQWFRQVNQSLVAKSEQQGPSLHGDSSYFEATTMNPLVGEPGVSEPIRWEVEDGLLWYQESDIRLQITEMPANSVIVYRTQAGRWVSDWPLGDDSQLLPSAVAIDSDKEYPVLANLRMRVKPDLLLEESRRERE